MGVKIENQDMIYSTFPLKITERRRETRREARLASHRETHSSEEKPKRVLCLVLSKVRVSGLDSRRPFIYVVRERATARPDDKGLSTYPRETENTARDWQRLLLIHSTDNSVSISLG